MAIVGHNRRSGATAFFQAGVLDAVDARKIPSPMGFRPLPNEPAAGDYWLSPSRTAAIACYKCHDNGPFVHSPYVDQVKVNNQLIVPVIDRNPPGPYWFVGSQAFSNWPQPKYFKKAGQNNNYTSCHAIGNGPSSGQFIQLFTGRESPHQITESFKRYPLSHYMPNVSLTAGYPTKEAWEATWGAAVVQLLAAKRTPEDSSLWTPVQPFQ